MKSPHKVISQINKIDENELPTLKRRIDAASAIVLLLIGFLVFRLWFLQIHNGPEYQQLSEKNRIRAQHLSAPRGNISDRKNRLITTNRPSFNVTWVQEDAPNPDEVIKKLSRILNEDISTLLDRIRQSVDRPRYMPVSVAEDISWPSLVQIENHRFELPGIRIEAHPSRSYLYSNTASHLIGYLGQINQKELKIHSVDGYRQGDQFGKMGIEKLFEKHLHGEKGRRFLEVDVHGFEQRELQLQEAMAGSDIQLSIDIELQRTAEEAIAGKAGAIVVMEVNTGRLLVLASAPPLDLNDFVGGISTKVWNSLLQNPLNPLLNKALQGQYPPGSTYKIITAMAALSEKAITKDTIYYCSGSMKFGNRTYGCWKRRGHGPVNLHKAITESCDVYFYQAGLKIGVDKLALYAKSFGLGKKTGIILENEKAGLVPTSDWKVRKYQEPWQEGETLSIAIGQGFNLTTPLQVCAMTAATANGGTLYRPQLVEKITTPDGEILQQFSPTIDGRILGSQRALKYIQKGLIGVVNDKRGTGRRAKLDTILVAGKTGTAQVVRINRQTSELEKEIKYKHRDHAWFTSYAPADKPEIAISVIVEHGGHGGAAAAPIAKKILLAYFELEDEELTQQTNR